MKNFPFKHNGEELWYSRSVATSVVAFAEVKGVNCVLAVLRGPGCEYNAGYWNVPGGFLDFDETTKECAAREFYEETGIRIPEHTLWFQEIYSKPETKRQTVVIRYAIRVDADVINGANTEHSEKNEVADIRWIPLKSLDHYEWTFNQKAMIRTIADKWGLL